MVGDLGQHGAEIEFRVEPVQLRRSDQAVDGGGTLASTIGRQFIVPEFWRMKSQLPTLFIR